VHILQQHDPIGESVCYIIKITTHYPTLPFIVYFSWIIIMINRI